MRPRRLAFALVALAGAAAAQASCVAVLGLDDDLASAVEAICKCSGSSYPGGQSACRDTLGRRLDNATDAKSADWLHGYVDNRCTDCKNAWKCFEAAPTCSDTPCDSDLQCCSSDGKEAKCDVKLHACQ